MFKKLTMVLGSLLLVSSAHAFNFNYPDFDDVQAQLDEFNRRADMVIASDEAQNIVSSVEMSQGVSCDGEPSPSSTLIGNIKIKYECSNDLDLTIVAKAKAESVKVLSYKVKL